MERYYDIKQLRSDNSFGRAYKIAMRRGVEKQIDKVGDVGFTWRW